MVNEIINKIKNPFGKRQGDFCLLIALFSLAGCTPELEKTTAEEFKQTIHGEAQGTTWTITYYDIQERNFTAQVDSLLARVDESISTYKPNSIISQWNASDSGTVIDDMFLDVLIESWYVYRASDGAFDPTVKPLVSFWGFGPEKYEHPERADKRQLDSLKALVGLDTLKLYAEGKEFLLEEVAAMDIRPEFFLKKPDARIQLDFNAIGQGWSVDKVADFFSSHELKIFFVEIGGEIVAGNPKPSGELWRFGVDKPESNLENRSLQAIVNLRNRGLATSGSYRKFYERDGVKYSHTINPATGRPVNHSLLSATVFSPSAAEADGMATAFMVMGKDSTLQFLNEKEYLSDYVYLIYDSAGIMKTYASPQVRKLIEDQ
ncbi:MAG: FAD:protein FMN transferase [Flavobacteriales bacterium]